MSTQSSSAPSEGSAGAAFSRWHALVLTSLPQDLSEKAIRRWSQNIGALQTALRTALSAAEDDRPLTWKVVDLESSRKGVSWYATELSERGVSVNAETLETLGHAEVSGTTRSQLALLSVREMGLEHGASYQAILDVALSMGLRPCSPIAALLLGLERPFPAADRWLRVAVDPLPNDVIGKAILKLGVDDRYGPMLTVEDGSFNAYWGPDDMFVFCLIRS